jgi:hypothetical protein
VHTGSSTSTPLRSLLEEQVVGDLPKLLVHHHGRLEHGIRAEHLEQVATEALADLKLTQRGRNG